MAFRQDYIRDLIRDIIIAGFYHKLQYHCGPKLFFGTSFNNDLLAAFPGLHFVTCDNVNDLFIMARRDGECGQKAIIARFQIPPQAVPRGTGACVLRQSRFRDESVLFFSPWQ